MLKKIMQEFKSFFAWLFKGKNPEPTPAPELVKALIVSEKVGVVAAETVDKGQLVAAVSTKRRSPVKARPAGAMPIEKVIKKMDEFEEIKHKQDVAKKKKAPAKRKPAKKKSPAKKKTK